MATTTMVDEVGRITEVELSEIRPAPIGGPREPGPERAGRDRREASK